MANAGIDPRLLEILVCPLTKGPLRYDAAAQELISDQARLAYPIRDSIPIMLIDEARNLDDVTSKTRNNEDVTSKARPASDSATR